MSFGWTCNEGSLPSPHSTAPPSSPTNIADSPEVGRSTCPRSRQVGWYRIFESCYLTVKVLGSTQSAVSHPYPFSTALSSFVPFPQCFSTHPRPRCPSDQNSPASKEPQPVRRGSGAKTMKYAFPLPRCTSNAYNTTTPIARPIEPPDPSPDGGCCETHQDWRGCQLRVCTVSMSSDEVGFC